MLSKSDEVGLKKRGWNVYADSYYKHWKKDELIEQIRNVEHNYATEIWGCELLTRRLENICIYLKKQGLSMKEINKIIAVDRERL